MEVDAYVVPRGIYDGVYLDLSIPVPGVSRWALVKRHLFRRPYRLFPIRARSFQPVDNGGIPGFTDPIAAYAGHRQLLNFRRTRVCAPRQIRRYSG